MKPTDTKKIIYVKDKKMLKWWKQQLKDMKDAFKYFDFKMDFCEEYNILYIGFHSDKKAYSTVELDSDIRLDVDKNGNVLGVEIEDFMNKIRRKTTIRRIKR